MISQDVGVTEDFAKEWNNSLYSRQNKILCEFKEQARARPSVRNAGPPRPSLLPVSF